MGLVGITREYTLARISISPRQIATNPLHVICVLLDLSREARTKRIQCALYSAPCNNISGLTVEQVNVSNIARPRPLFYDKKHSTFRIALWCALPTVRWLWPRILRPRRCLSSFAVSTLSVYKPVYVWHHTYVHRYKLPVRHSCLWESFRCHESKSLWGSVCV